MPLDWLAARFRPASMLLCDSDPVVLPIARTVGRAEVEPPSCRVPISTFSMHLELGSNNVRRVIDFLLTLPPEETPYEDPGG
jgi:hypothetical protein